jgi:cell division protein FtsI (penicillin-binding protein 3)
MFAIDSLFNSKHNNLDSLADCLARHFQDRTKEGYKAHLRKGLKSKDRQYLISTHKASYADYKKIQSFPFLRIPRNGSFFTKRETMQRHKPFGTLASRTIGDIYGEILESGVTKARSGLEQQYDSLLRGIPGISSFRRSGASWVPVIEVEPVDGIDIRSTIDVEIQDVVEKTLSDMLRKTDADAGTAVVMEVKTGEIKAMTNMARTSPGHYSETMNHAVADVIEPGSTFKVAAMMVAIEDGVAVPSTPVDVGDGTFHYTNRTMTDHNHNRGGYGKITAEKSIWYSSNIGVAKIILSGYDKDPKKFVDGLHRIGMDADLKIGLPEANRARLRHPGDKYWSKTSLPWMSFGYEVQIPPVQTLTFFNAIANNGKMVRPKLVNDFLKNGEVVKHFNTEVIIPQICSQRTLKIIQDMLYNVVNYKDPTSAHRDGTGKPAKSDIITIAGKTGTAQIARNGTYKTGAHNVSFCGYFPYENPQYTCIVVISHPREGVVSGGQMCGTVVKDIAEKIYSASIVFDVAKIADDSLKVAKPEMLIGNDAALKRITGELKVSAIPAASTASAASSASSASSTMVTTVPDVTGMGAKDAIYAIEQCGMRAAVSGYGKVEAQSVKTGAKAVAGQTVILTLK